MVTPSQIGICVRCHARMARQAWCPPRSLNAAAPNCSDSSSTPASASASVSSATTVLRPTVLAPTPMTAAVVPQKRPLEREASPSSRGSPEPTPCTLCFDLLSSTEHAHLVAAIRGAARFDPAAWSDVHQIRRLNIAVPLAIDTLRHHLTVHHLLQQQPSDIRPIPSVKEWLRRDIAHLLLEECNAESDQANRRRTPMLYCEGASADADAYGVSIDVQVTHPVAEREMTTLMEMKEAGLQYQFLRPANAKSRKKQRLLPGKPSIMKALEERIPPSLLISTFPLDQLASGLQQQPTASSAGLSYHASITTDTIFLGGRYCKFRRDVSQTPFFGGPKGTLRCEHSVSAFIERAALSISGAEHFNMHSSGREDMNVRMLGQGRPFYVELKNPSKITWTATDLDDLQSRIHEDAARPLKAEVLALQTKELPLENVVDRRRAATHQIWISDLHRVSPESVQKIKFGESEKRKVYRCLVEAPFALTQDWFNHVRSHFPLTVDLAQRTPERVEHRRADLIRHRQLTMTSILPHEEPHQFILQLDAEAGTYIKEFVHGDKARTTPSLYDVLAPLAPLAAAAAAAVADDDDAASATQLEITHLDVTDVILPWPTAEDIINA